MGYHTTDALIVAIGQTDCRSGNAILVALQMASMVYDDDNPNRPEDKLPRRYYAGYKPLAPAIGRMYFESPETAEQKRVNDRTQSAVSTAIGLLVKHGLIKKIKTAFNGLRAEYELLPNITAIAAEVEHSSTNF